VDRGLVDLALGMRAIAPHLRQYLLTTERARMTWGAELLPALDGYFTVADTPTDAQVDAFCDWVERLGVRSLLIANCALACEALPVLRRRLPGLRVVVQVHSFDTDRRTGRPMGRAADAASRFNNLIDLYAVISERAGAVLSERLYVSPSKIRTVYLGIDRNRFGSSRPARSTARFQLLWLGRLSEEKDPLLALEVARRLKARYGGETFGLTLAGGGPLEPLLQKRRRALGLEDVVTLTGAVDDPLPLLQEADGLLLTSRYEGIPIVIFEAMAAGLPVVTSIQNTAIPEVLSPEDALLVGSRDPDDFVASIERLIFDPALRTQLSDACRAKAPHFSRERYAAETLELLLPTPALSKVSSA
jgi:glycosyltransferase involved in cell wall biosynthesis